ncbi:MAG: caspase family protein [Saprospiraceae bacterium]|nr:caspase family protein [Saprospiraceae bacterium]
MLILKNRHNEKLAYPPRPAYDFCHLEGTLAQSIDMDKATTRAVVVGISDYQDMGIPDLRFADRDAEAFANWLRSPAGGSVPERNLVLLTNKQATIAQFAKALDGLMETVKEGDLVIIYFSGHGDWGRRPCGKTASSFATTRPPPPTWRALTP